IARDERLGTARTADPCRVVSFCQLAQPPEHPDLEKRQVARDDEHAIGRRDLERRVESSERAAAREEVGGDRHVQARESPAARTDAKTFSAHLLQTPDLTDDEGAAADAEAALVPTAETARLTARQNRCGNVGPRPCRATHGTHNRSPRRPTAGRLSA